MTIVSSKAITRFDMKPSQVRADPTRRLDHRGYRVGDRDNHWQQFERSSQLFLTS
jgi:hypothetical protein